MDLNTEARREYLRGALWVLPGVGVVVALVAGSLLSLIEIDEDSSFDILAFQGTSEDARALLIGIAATVITVMALMLGLTVVALQLASTQFSPRLLRNFLHDRPNQLVLAVLVTTFTYSTAGLFTVGVSSGARSEEFPRLAVSGALVLMFASLIAIVFFIHHLMHGIQIDAIISRVERSTLQVLDVLARSARRRTADRSARAAGVGGRGAREAIGLCPDDAPRDRGPARPAARRGDLPGATSR